MGSSSSNSKSKTPKKEEANKGNIQNENLQQADKNQNLESKINQTHLRHNESIIDRSKPFLELESDISKELSKKICRIVVEIPGGKNIGTGFILAFTINSELFYGLITNNHVIKDESINNNQIIYISYEEYKTSSTNIR